jgi:hypothetical protein
MICKGRVLDLIPLTDTVIQVVLQAKKKDSFFPVAFTAYLEIKILIQQIKIEKGDTVKVEYYIKSKKWQDKYLTSAVIDKIKIIAKKPSQQLLVDMETGEVLG